MKIGKASPKAIRYACLNFHYAKAVPVSRHSFNVYNGKGEWCGVIMYGSGANNHIGGPFGLYQGEILELVRVALNGKQEATSQAVAMTLRELKNVAPHVKMVVSYADLDQDHAGTIYQATNWLYLGKYNVDTVGAFIVNGKKTHPKSLHSKGYKQSLEWLQRNVDRNAKAFRTKGKHKYIFCLDKRLRRQWAKQAKPYPKKEAQHDTAIT